MFPVTRVAAVTSTHQGVRLGRVMGFVGRGLGRIQAPRRACGPAGAARGEWGIRSPRHGRHIATQCGVTGACGPTPLCRRNVASRDFGLRSVGPPTGFSCSTRQSKMETTRERAISIFRAENGGFDPLLSRLQIAARSGGLLSGGPPKGFSCSA
jgi:hypothetical protein